MSNDYLTKAEFYQYMGEFRTALEKRLSSLENKKNNPNGQNSKDKLIYILIGAVLVLAGVGAGAQFLKGLF
jgi:hypothetical protein